jgi:hypothetical protein
VTILDRVLEASRPLPLRGKGRLFNRFTPHTGSREVRATLDGGRAVAGSWTQFDVDPSHETDCLFVHRRAQA